MVTEQNMNVNIIHRGKVKQKLGDFPGGPVVKNLPSNAGDAGQTLVGELRSHMLRGN